MRHIAPLAVLWAIVCAPRPLSAQATERPSVTRESGAEGCPDGPQLAERVASIRGQPGVNVGGASQIAGYHVTFTHHDAEFSAAIHAGVESQANVRMITARGETCEALAQATAVTLALLLDAEASSREEGPVPESEPPNFAHAQTRALRQAPPPVPTTSATSPAMPLDVWGFAAEKPRLQGTFAVGAGTLLGVLRPVLPEFSGEAGFIRAHLRAGFGLMWTLPETVKFGPGNLREFLLAGTTRLCVSPLPDRTLRFDLCSGAFAGVSDVHARGYSRNDHRQRPWLAIPVGASLSYLARPAGFELSALALIPLLHHDFSIDGLGKAYQSWPVALSLSLRLLGLWP